MALTLAEVEEVVRASRLDPRGAFHPVAADRVPPLATGGDVQTVVLVGNAGGRMWQAFRAAAESRTTVHPLDAWTRRVVGEIAAEVGCEAIFPFGGPPFHPFQRWARRAEPVHASPLGLLIHPVHGLWHAYRGALLIADRLELAPVEQLPSPCESCAAKPCLGACPVDAFTGTAFDVSACVAHATCAGSDCRASGCLARRACPIGSESAYDGDQKRFHMAAFLAARS